MSREERFPWAPEDEQSIAREHNQRIVDGLGRDGLQNLLEDGARISALQRVPAEPIRLTPEQEACPHPLEKLTYNRYQTSWKCGDCGAEFVDPEMLEYVGLDVASELFEK